MFESWFKSNPRRHAIREGRRESRVFWRRLKERGGIASIGIAACFCALLAGLFMLFLSPHYPWYFAWLLVFATLLPGNVVTITATGTSFKSPAPNGKTYRIHYEWAVSK